VLRPGFGDTQGFHLKLSNRPDVLARLSRADVNMPNYRAFPVHVLVPEVKFEAAVYELLRLVPNILVSRLLYYRTPAQHVAPRLGLPQDITGRHLFLFERAEGEKNVWYHLCPEEKVTAFISHLFSSIRFSCTNILSRFVF